MIVENDQADLANKYTSIRIKDPSNWYSELRAIRVGDLAFISNNGGGALERLRLTGPGALKVAGNTIQIGDQLGTLYQLGAAVTLTAAQINDAAQKSAANTLSAVNTFSARTEHSGAVALAATQKIFLDGVAGVGDTYLYESAANIAQMVAGTKATRFDGGAVRLDTDMSIRFQAGQASLGGIFALETITTGDKTFTFPNKTGNVALQGVSVWTFVTENVSITTTSSTYQEVAIASTAWPGASFANLREAYFEAVIGETGADICRVQLYNATTAAEITNLAIEATGPARGRSTNIASSLTDNINIQVRLRNDGGLGTSNLWVARLILVW